MQGIGGQDATASAAGTGWQLPLLLVEVTVFTCPAGNGSTPSPACEVEEVERILEGLAQSEMARQQWAGTGEAAATVASPESQHYKEQQLLLAGHARSATCMHACAQGRLPACTLATRCRRGRLGRASGAAAAAAGSPG